MIPHDLLEDLRQRATLSEVIGDRVRLERRGRSHVGLCPFHKEKTPSFHVNDERGFYYCFGCKASGDCITFLRETDGLSFNEAVLELAERFGIEVKLNQSSSERRQQEEAKRRREELFSVNHAAAKFYQQCLRDHPLAHFARGELERRGIALDDAPNTNANTPVSDAARALDAFCIGYAPAAWDELVRHLRQAGLSLQSAERVGLIAPRKSGEGHYDRFRHRLMFAIFDLKGRVIGFSGRALPAPAPSDRPDEPPAKYINSPESPIYKKREAVFGLFQARAAIRHLDQAILVEGNFDVVGLHARGLAQAVAPLGTAFTEEQAALIKRYTSNVTLLFDADDAGQRATSAAREPCLKQGLVARVATLPAGADPDDYVRSHGAQGLEASVKAARSMLEYLIDTILDRFDSRDAQGRVAKIREVAELIRAEDDPAVRAMAKRHADMIAARLGISDAPTFDALRATVERALAAPAGAPERARTPRAHPPGQARSPARQSQIARQLLGALIEFPELLDDAGVVEALGRVGGEFSAYIDALKAARAQASTDGFLAALPEKLLGLARTRLASPELSEVDAGRRVVLDNAEKLRKLVDQRETREVIEQLHRASTTGAFDEQLALLEQHQKRARERRGL